MDTIPLWPLEQNVMTLTTECDHQWVAHLDSHEHIVGYVYPELPFSAEQPKTCTITTNVRGMMNEIITHFRNGIVIRSSWLRHALNTVSHEFFITHYDNELTYQEWLKQKQRLPVAVLDIETDSQSLNAAISSVGVCIGDLASGEIFKTNQWNIDVRTQPGRVRDHNTVNWWAKIKAETPAIEKITSLVGESLDVFEFIEQFNALMTECNGVEVFGNGCEFDNANLITLYAQLGATIPWQFRRNQSMRTAVLFGRQLLKFDPKYGDEEKWYIKHLAIHDAIHEFNYCSAIFREFMSKLGMETLPCEQPLPAN